MTTVAIVILLLYFIVLIIIGIKSADKNSSDDFFLAKRSFKPYALALSFIAAWYGGSSCIVSSNEAFTGGFGSFWITSAPNALAPLLLIVFVVWIRNLNLTSMVQALDVRYKSKTMTWILTFIVIWYMITFAAAQVVAVGQFFSAYFGFSYLIVCLVGTIVTVVYCFFGGFRGVVLTCNIQFYLLLAGMLIIAVTAVKVAGGFGAIGTALDAKTATDSVQYFNLFDNFGRNFMYTFSYCLAWIISADGWQRINSSKSPRDAKKMLWMVVIIFIPLGCLALIAGMGGAAIYDVLPEGGIMAALIRDYLPPFLGALVFVGVGAAIMSTMATAVSAGALTFTYDWYQKLRPNASSHKLVVVGMISTLVVGAIALFVALQLRDILWVLWMSADILCCAVLCPLMGGFLWKGATKAGGLASMIGGGLFVLYNYICDLGANFPTFWPAWPYRLLVGLGIAIALFVVVSLFTKKDEALTAKFWKDSREGVAGVESESAAGY